MLIVPIVKPTNYNIPKAQTKNIPEKHYQQRNNLSNTNVAFTSRLVVNTPIRDAEFWAYSIKRDNPDKKAVIFTDFDGTLFPFYSQETPAELIKQKEFQNLLNASEQTNQPIFLLTSRSINHFLPKDLDTEFHNTNLNILGLRGNEILVTLPENEKTEEFIDSLKSNPLAETYTEKTDKGIRVLSVPVTDSEFVETTKTLKEELKNTGLKLEEKNAQVMIRWRQLREDVKNTNQSGKTYTIDNVSPKFYNGFKKHLTNPQNSNITIINPENLAETVKCSFEELLDYSLLRFNETYDAFLSKPSNDRNHAHIKTYDTYSELNLTNFMKKDKGMSLDEIMNLFDKEYYPIFLGDDIGKNKDDESAMKSANKRCGYGIGVIGRFNEEKESFAKGKFSVNLAHRLTSVTDSKCLLESYEEVQPFITRILRK